MKILKGAEQESLHVRIQSRAAASEKWGMNVAYLYLLTRGSVWNESLCPDVWGSVNSCMFLTNADVCICEIQN